MLLRAITRIPGTVMKLIAIIAAATLVSATLPAQAAATDPLRAIYRVSGVTANSTAAGVGAATTFHCTNFSPVSENIRFTTRIKDGTVVSTSTTTLVSNGTITASTHPTTFFNEDVFLSTGLVTQGSTVILATSLAFHCSAMIVDAGSAFPQGFALHLLRVNPLANSQE